MNYFFSIRGLKDINGVVYYDYSRDDYNDIDDTQLSDGAIGRTP